MGRSQPEAEIAPRDEARLQWVAAVARGTAPGADDECHPPCQTHDPPPVIFIFRAEGDRLDRISIVDDGPNEIRLILRCQVMATKVFGPKFLRPVRSGMTAGRSRRATCNAPGIC